MTACDNQCRHYQQYVSSQRSLEALTETQAGALARVGKLRAGILATLRKHYPGPYSETHNKIPTGITSLPDDVLLTYLDGFLTLPPTTVSARMALTAAMRDQLAGALTAAGHHIAAGVTFEQLCALVAATSGTALPTTDAAATETENEHPPITPEPLPGSSFTMDDLFDEEPPFDPFDDPDITSDAAMPGVGGDSFDEADGRENEDTVLQRSPLRLAVPSVAADNVDDLFGPVQPVAPFTPTPTDTDNTTASTPPDVPAVALPNAEEPAVDDASASTLVPASANEPAAGASRTSRRTGVSKVQPTLLSTGSTKPKNTRKRPVGSATSPAGFVSAPTVAVPAELDAIFKAALSAPRPVFVSDLATGGVTADMVTSWVATQAVAADPIVRVVGAKDHHLERGDLLVPHASLHAGLPVEYSNSVWGRCVAGLRGPRLYEAGVVLSAFGKARSLEFDTKLLVLTVDEGSALTGVIVTTAADVKPSSTLRAALGKAIADVNDKRVASIYVVTTSANRKAPTDIAEALHVAADTEGWNCTAPVVVTRSVELGKADPTLVAAIG